METVPRVECFRLGWNSEGKRREEEDGRRPQIEDPPSESGEKGPMGSPVCRVKEGWILDMGEKL